MFEEKILTLADAKLDDSGSGRVSGYGSVFGGIDSYGDTIVPGAYKGTIPQFLKDGFIAWSHDWAFPIATPDKAREDERGLWIEAAFHTDAESQRARQIVAERLERGKSMGLSIGYQAKGFDFQEVDGQQVRRLLDIELMEVSLVMVPADAAARVASVKAKRRLSRHQLEAVIATLQALMGDEDEQDVADALAGDAEDGKATGIDLATAGAGDLIAALKARAAELTSAEDAALLEGRGTLADLIGALAGVRADLDAALKRAESIGADDPRELFRRFQALDIRLGHIATGHRAVV